METLKKEKRKKSKIYNQIKVENNDASSDIKGKSHKSTENQIETICNFFNNDCISKYQRHFGSKPTVNLYPNIHFYFIQRLSCFISQSEHE